MKLLLDQNLSQRIITKLPSAFEGSKHVKDYGLTGDDDEAIWLLAAGEGLTPLLPVVLISAFVFLPAGCALLCGTVWKRHHAVGLKPGQLIHSINGVSFSDLEAGTVC